MDLDSTDTKAPVQPEFVQYTENEFYHKYKPIPAEDGGDTWEFRDIKQGLEQHQINGGHVWSLVDSGDPDHNGAFACPGYHVVNVYGYSLTEVPWEHDNIEAEWIEHDPDKEE